MFQTAINHLKQNSHLANGAVLTATTLICATTTLSRTLAIANHIQRSEDCAITDIAISLKAQRWSTCVRVLKLGAMGVWISSLGCINRETKIALVALYTIATVIHSLHVKGLDPEEREESLSCGFIQHEHARGCRLHNHNHRKLNIYNKSDVKKYGELYKKNEIENSDEEKY